MYLTDSLKLGKKYIAIVPLVVYVSGFIATVITKPVSKFLKNEVIISHFTLSKSQHKGLWVEAGSIFIQYIFMFS